MLWWELSAVLWHFLVSLAFLILATRSRAVSEQIWRRDEKLRRLRLREINPGYWYFKCEVYNFFTYVGKDKLAAILTTVNKLLEGEMTRSPISLTTCQQSKALRVKLAKLMAEIVSYFQKNQVVSGDLVVDIGQEAIRYGAKEIALMLFQITSYYLKNEMVEFMYDLKGYRRWRLAISHLQKALDKRGSTVETSHSSRMTVYVPKLFQCNCSNCDPQVCPSDFRLFLFTRLRLRFQHIFLPIGLILWDNWSDGNVLFNYVNIWRLTNSTLLSNSTIIGGVIPSAGNVPEISFPVILLTLIILFSSLTLLISIFGTSPTSCSPRALPQGLKTAERMNDPQQVFEEKDYWGFASRYQLTIAEASSESLAQHMVQWAAYFSLTLLLSGTDSSGEYDLTFRTLVYSGLASITALTISQVRTNDIFHELSLTKVQKFLYILASLVNTLSHSSLLVFICTTAFDLTFLISAKKSFFLALASLLFFFLLLPAIYVLTSYWGKATKELDLRWEQKSGSEFGEKERILGTNAIRHTNYNNQAVRKFLYHTENLFCHLRLPTSVSNLANQPICYQTACDSRTVLLTSLHYFTLHLYFLLSSLLLAGKHLWIYLDPTIRTPTLEFFSARHNLLIVAYCLPFTFMAAILLLHLYLTGTFLCNSLYLGYPETCWEDLGPVTFSLATTLGLNPPEDVTVSCTRYLKKRHHFMETNIPTKTVTLTRSKVESFGRLHITQDYTSRL